ncbi:MAG TPA: DNA methyltransferase [Pseudonocardiaceae bacterium]|nr:DNA methyltransferase [Pseudonocardiaceae bacterium]
MTRFDSIKVEGDFVSEHYLVEEFGNRVRALRKDWAERESTDQTTSRQGLTALGVGFVTTLTACRENPATGLSKLYGKVRCALQLNRPIETFTTWRGSEQLTIPATVFRDSGRVHLLVVQAGDARSVEDVLDVEATGRLVAPLMMGDKPEPATARALSALFLADSPADQPAFILVLAGGWALLAERERWPEGRWLAVDLATVAERRDTTAVGEIETVAALLSADALLPAADGTCLLQRCLDESVKHAVGVSQDLRDGVRLSIELVATEVVDRRRAAGLPIDGVPDLARQLTRQSLRFLYRILFLLYAEARPELGVLPVDAPEYTAGYGLDRLRELVSVPLASDTARRGTHLYESLHRLFILVDKGFVPNGNEADDGGRLRFESLRADLFQPKATTLVDEVKLGNRCLQRVLDQLLLSKERRGRDRGFVSYAQLGINQLGAVYEGLMAYTGFFAEEPLYEVARGGDRTKGTWVVPVAKAEQLARKLGVDEDDANNVFVREKDPETGEKVRVRHGTGTFVFRLSGRDRQRSASYYTPEVLTRCVVTHSLAELLDQGGDTTPASAILDLTVCEPALGSGAFLIEAVNQLAEQYLKRRQGELDQRIPAEEFQAELQKVKAYLSLHQCYGVDLNDTAVEFAEISLWLNSMHPDLRAPWFGLHLKRGNSLIGARRAVYPKPTLGKKAWLTTVPDDRPLAEAIDVNEIHHFLLPSHGWAAVVDTKEAKELRPDEVTALKAWRSVIHKAPDKGQQDRLLRLARRVEKLWEFSRTRLRIAESEIRRGIDVWGADDLNSSTDAVSREDIETSMSDQNGAYRRLRRVMDAWCALWYWPITTKVPPPDWERWLDGLEGLLGVAAGGKPNGQAQLGDAEGWVELGEAERVNLEFNGARDLEWVLAKHPWLMVCQEIAEREGFLHWELDFSPVFERGGFDLQVGNPPWVRPTWDETLTLAETDAWFGLADKPSNAEVAEHRSRALTHYADNYLNERASIAGLSEQLGSGVDRPVLAGTQPDLYRCFMDRTWRSMCSTGIVGLIHPESHFTEARAGGLRRETYHRLRRHWGFRNEKILFEIMHTREYGVSVYGSLRPAQFLNISSLYLPETVDRSFVHDGSGAEPGVKDELDDWDVRPHRSRIVEVDESLLARWADLVDEPGTPPLEARMLRPVNKSSQVVLDKIARAPRLGVIDFDWTAGWHERADRARGYFESRSAVPGSWDDVILQGPHLTVANPFAKQPRSTMRSNQDYEVWDLEELREDAIPRTNYQRAKQPDIYIAGYPAWDGKSSNQFWRLAWRRMVDSSTVRSLHSSLIPKGATHVNAVLSLGSMESADVAVASGIWCSIVVDFVVKVSGKTDLYGEVVSRFPHVRHHSLESSLILRSLRLNCMTRAYEDLWAELYNYTWQSDSWTHDRTDRPALGDVTADWRYGTPLRTSFDRRQALVEIDAIAAIMLDITAEELCTIYRTQFGVLRKAEKAMRFDVNGRQVPVEVLKEYEKKGDRADLGRYVLPFTPVDREKDMTRAHEVLTERLRARR